MGDRYITLSIIKIVIDMMYRCVIKINIKE